MDGPRLCRLIAVLAIGSLVLLARGDPAASIAWHSPVDVAVGPAIQGPWRQSESRYDYVDDATVAFGSDGSIAVAWVDQARKRVLLQRYSADTPQLATPIDVSRHPQTFSWLPRLAFAPDVPGQLLVAWQEIVFSGGSHGGEIFFARSDDGGRSFAPPLNLSRSTGGDGKGRISRDVWHNGSFDLVAGPGGVVHVAWTEYDGGLWHSRSADGGRTFAPARRTPGAGRLPARAPSLALAPDGKVYLAWTVGEDSGADIRLSVSTDQGASWGPPRAVAPSPGYSDAPKLALDGAGVLHLAYGESDGGPFGRSHVRYARSRDGGRTFEPPREISTPLPAGAASATYPSLALDGAGNVLVTWELARAARQQPRGLAVAISKDGGDRFAAPTLVPGSADPQGGTNGSRQGLLMKKLAMGEQGAVAVVNSSFQSGVRSRVWLMRGALQR